MTSHNINIYSECNICTDRERQKCNNAACGGFVIYFIEISTIFYRIPFAFRVPLCNVSFAFCINTSLTKSIPLIVFLIASAFFTLIFKYYHFILFDQLCLYFFCLFACTILIRTSSVQFPVLTSNVNVINLSLKVLHSVTTTSH